MITDVIGDLSMLGLLLAIAGAATLRTWWSSRRTGEPTGATEAYADELHAMRTQLDRMRAAPAPELLRPDPLSPLVSVPLDDAAPVWSRMPAAPVLDLEVMTIGWSAERLERKLAEVRDRRMAGAA